MSYKLQDDVGQCPVYHLLEANADLKGPRSVLGPSAKPLRNDSNLKETIHLYLSTLDHHGMSDLFKLIFSF